MQIYLVNLTQLDPPRNGGAKRIAQEVARLLATETHHNPAFEVIFIVNWRFVEQFPAWLGVPADYVIPYVPADGDASFRVLEKVGVDAVISPLFGMEPFLNTFPQARHIAFIPDALALDMPDLFTPRQFEGRRRMYAQLPTATLLITPTEYTRRRLLQQLDLKPEQVTFVHHGADVLNIGEAPDDEATWHGLDLPSAYIYYPANLWPHKRHDLLLETMNYIWPRRPDIHLMLTGGARDQNGGLNALLARHNVPAERVIDLGYVSDRQVQALYRHAEAMLFTSSHEGFGMPIVEAMKNGCPVICAPVTAIPEVAGEAALYINTAAPADWANAFLDQLPMQREALINRGYAQASRFTWARAHQEWSTAMEQVGLQLHSGRPDTARVMLLDDVVGSLRRQQSIAALHWLPALDDLPDSRYREQLERLDALRIAESNHRWAKIPLLGLLGRLGVRLLNTGRMWNENQRLHAALIDRIHTLEARIEQLERQQSQD